MSNLFKINRDLEYLCDTETGEMFTEEQIEALQMEKNILITNLCLAVKNLQAEEKILDDEIKKLAERKATCGNRQNQLKAYIGRVLEGEKWDGDEKKRVKVQYHTSTTTVIDDIALIPAKYLKMAEPKPNMTDIKKAINDGEKIDGAHLEKRVSVVVK